jgi:hypothetical protein
MNNPKSLAAWVAASIQNDGKSTGWEVSPKIVLKAYFLSKGFLITDAIFTTIIGIDSEMYKLINQLETMIVATKIGGINSVEDINCYKLA